MKSTAGILVLFLLLAAAAGCGKNGGAEPKADGGAASTDGRKEKIVLRMATWETGESSKSVFEIAKKSFEAKHPHVTVKIEETQYDNYKTKLQTLIAAGDAPDILQVGEGDFNGYMRKGIVADLAPFASGSNPVDLNDITPSILEVLDVDGKIPVIPIGAATFAVFYNKALFDEAKLPYPTDDWTWEEFADIAAKLTKTENGKTVQYGTTMPTGANNVEILAMGNGGGFVTGDGQQAKGALDSEQTVEAVEWLARLFKSKAAPSPAELSAMKGIDLFGTGKVAMSIDGNWGIASKAGNPDLKFGVVGLPHFANGTKANLLYSSGFAMGSKTKHPQEAWDFIRELCWADTEAGKEWAKYQLVVTQSLAASSKQDQDPYMGVFIRQLEHVKTSAYFKNPNWFSVNSKYIDPAVEDIILNGADVRQALSDAAEKIDNELSQAAK